MKFIVAIAVFIITQASYASLPVLSDNMPENEILEFAKIGAGYYPIPKKLKKHLSYALNLTRDLTLYKSTGRVRQQEVSQMNYLLLYKEDWARSQATQIIADTMQAIATDMLDKIIGALKINRNWYETAAADWANATHEVFLKYGFYDPSINKEGIEWHKDFRWISVLYAPQKGLMGEINGVVVKVPPSTDYFVINIGLMLEAFVNDKSKLNAFLHKVAKQQKIRRSIIVACDKAAGDDYYQIVNGELKCRQNPESLRYYKLPIEKKRIKPKPTPSDDVCCQIS